MCKETEEKTLKIWREKGKIEGKIEIMVEMVKDEAVSVSDAAKRLKITEEEFKKYLD